MQLKFLKYWADIPPLYLFAFILDPRAKLRGFHKVLQLLNENTGSDYNMYYVDVKTKIHKLFDKYERKFVAGRSQRVTQPLNQIGKRKPAWWRIFGGSGACYLKLLIY
jgi:hypothetical protein